jgi:diguanylate cyclase (GGDEF)-like protein
MSSAHERRRVLVAATEPERHRFRALFRAEPLGGWEAEEADSFERARFLLQMDPCDVLLLDASLDPLGGTSGLAWLAGEYQTPVVFLADAGPGVVLDALRQGAHHWLPRQLALGQPEVLDAVLGQAARHGDVLRRLRRSAEALDDCKRQVSRLVSLLWESSPGAPLSGWLPQRHVMERLHEEVARAQRHGGPLAVVLGEAQGPWGARPPAAEADRLGRWVAERIGRGKRRCDVAGQYGPHNFLLLLPGATDFGAAGCCRRLRQLLETPAVEGDAPPAGLSVYFGVVNYSPATPSVKSLLRRAEERLEYVKESAPQTTNAHPFSGSSQTSTGTALVCDEPLNGWANVSAALTR